MKKQNVVQSQKLQKKIECIALFFYFPIRYCVFKEQTRTLQANEFQKTSEEQEKNNKQQKKDWWQARKRLPNLRKSSKNIDERTSARTDSFLSNL